MRQGLQFAIWMHLNRTMPTLDAISTEDRWIHHPQGKLFSRAWTPESGHQPGSAPLVLLHESLGSVAQWRDFPAQLALATGRRVIAYDRLGFGRSAPRHGAMAPDFIRKEAQSFFPAVRAQWDLERFALFGHSVGGGMGVECAARWPEGCEALITEAAQAFLETLTITGIRQAQQVFADPAQMERLARYHGSQTRWVLDAWINTWLSPAFASWSLDAVLPQVRCPVLALHGEHDEYGSSAHPQRIAEFCGGAVHIEILGGLHHVPHRENPQRILDLAADFLRQI
jgi:pimeloyl-ACP methyl ester carboxylesterase